MTSNSRRLSWTTRWPRDMPPCSTLRPQVKGALCSSSCLRAHRSRGRRVLRQPLTLLPPTPTMAGKARGRGKARTTALAAPKTTAAITTGAPWHGPPSTISGPVPSRCVQGCILCSSSWCIHRNMPCSLHQCTMGLLAVPPSRPCRCLHRTSNRSRPCLVALDERERSTVIGQLLQHHDLDSPDSHRLGHGLRHLQPHQLRCR
jgi:hypothetical protein